MGEGGQGQNLMVGLAAGWADLENIPSPYRWGLGGTNMKAPRSFTTMLSDYEIINDLVHVNIWGYVQWCGGIVNLISWGHISTIYSISLEARANELDSSMDSNVREWIPWWLFGYPATTFVFLQFFFKTLPPNKRRRKKSITLIKCHNFWAISIVIMILYQSIKCQRDLAYKYSLTSL